MAYKSPESIFQVPDDSKRPSPKPAGTATSTTHIQDEVREVRLGYYMTILKNVVEVIPFTVIFLRSLDKNEPVDSLNRDSEAMYQFFENLRKFSFTGIRKYDDVFILSELENIFVYINEVTTKYSFSSPEYKSYVKSMQVKLNAIKARAEGHLQNMGIG
jgi:hypothetical protein